jgi:hypothetical protein
MERDVFRKTEAGHAIIRQRGGGLDAKARTLLILTNGQLGVAELAAQVGFDPIPALQDMLTRGWLERVAPAPAPMVRLRPAPAPTPVFDPPPPAPAARSTAQKPGADAPPAAFVPAELGAAKSRALRLLASHYGPDALTVAEGLLATRSEPDFAHALQALHDKLAVHMGKRLAASLAREIAQGP